MKALYSVVTAVIVAFSVASFAADTTASDRLPRPPGGRGQPPEAPVACVGKAAGTVVATTLVDDKVITGTCQIIFRPERPPAT